MKCYKCGSELRNYPTTNPFYIESYICDSCKYRIEIHVITGEVFILNEGELVYEIPAENEVVLA